MPGIRPYTLQDVIQQLNQAAQAALAPPFNETEIVTIVITNPTPETLVFSDSATLQAETGAGELILVWG